MVTLLDSTGEPARFSPLNPATWPQAPTRSRDYGRFRSSHDQTLILLEREMDKLASKHIRIEVAYRPRDIRQDGQPRADAVTPEFPGVILSFDSKHGSLRYLTDEFVSWQANLRAIALSLEALRAVDRYGVSRRGEQYRGWGELPSGVPMGAAMTIEEAAGLLGVDLTETYSHDFVRAQWKKLAAVHHPDVGGDPETFRKLTRARDLLLELTR